MLLRTIAVSLVFTLVLAACGKEQPVVEGADNSDAYIVAVNNPLAYFAGRLIGDRVEVLTLFPDDIDPAMWLPGVEEALQLQGAELVLLNGAGYEKWLDKISLAQSKLVVTSAGAKDQWIALDNQVTHSHGPQGEHAHGDYAFTTWMDYSLARRQAQAVAAALQRHWPQHSAEIDGRLQALVTDLDALDEKYQALAGKLAGRQLIYSHPVYQYFQQRYQLSGQSVHWEPGEMPDESQWNALQPMLGERSLFVWEGQPEADIVARMTSLQLPYVVIDPAANRGEQDWLSVQRSNLAGLSRQAGAGE